MPINRPGRVLLSNIPLTFVAKKVSGGGAKPVDAAIPLVPFIDFLITLVVFLLTSFSASGELLAQQPNLRMPQAANVVDLEIAPIIAINPQVMTLDGRRMADTQSLASNPQMERIEQLVQDLETLKRNWSILHPSQPFPATVIIQADVNIDFRVIKKAMFSAAQAGYSNISFAVNRRGEH
jgi:biopolymer transport protein ExbD